MLWKWLECEGGSRNAWLFLKLGGVAGFYLQNKLVIFDKLSTIMFFGKILTQGQSYKFSPDQAEASQGQVLSLTNVVWAPTSKDAASLWIKKDNAEFLLASLNKEKSHAAINVFISLLDEVTLIVKGNGVLHVTGFFEPDQQGDLPLGEQELESVSDEEEEDESEEVEVKPATKLAVPAKAPSKVVSPQQKPQSPQQKAQVPTKAAAKKQEVEEESDDDEDEDLDDLEDEDLDDEIDDEEEDDDEEEEEEDDDDEEEIEAPPQKHVKHDGPKPQFKQNQGGKPHQGGKPNFQQGGKPNFQQGGKPNFQQGGKPGFNKGGNKPWNNNNNQKGGKPWGNNNNNQKGGKPWGNNNNQKGGKPFNKGGKNFQKH